MQTPLSASLLSVHELILVVSDGRAEASAGSMEKGWSQTVPKRETFRFERLLFRFGRPLFRLGRELVRRRRIAFHYEEAAVPLTEIAVPEQVGKRSKIRECRFIQREKEASSILREQLMASAVHGQRRSFHFERKTVPPFHFLARAASTVSVVSRELSRASASLGRQ